MANERTTEVTQRGNVTEVNIRPNRQSLASSPLEGKGEVVFSNGESEYKSYSPTTVTASDTGPTRGGILGTARSPAGAPAVTLNDSTIVTCNGITMPLSSAVRAGLVRKVAPGHYEEVGGEAPSQTQGEAPAEPKSNEPGLPADPIVSKYREALGDRATENIAMQVINSTDPTRAIRDASGALGVPSSTLEADVMDTYHSFKGKAESYISKTHGVDGKEVLQFAREYLHPITLRELSMRQFLQGRLDVWDVVVQEYRKVKARGER